MALSCLHRGIGRPKAEQLLLEDGEDGSYLVRESETVAGGYTLCLLLVHFASYIMGGVGCGRVGLKYEFGLVG